MNRIPAEYPVGAFAGFLTESTLPDSALIRVYGDFGGQGVSVVTLGVLRNLVGGGGGGGGGGGAYETLGDGTVLAIGTNYSATLAADRTLTFSGTPTDGSRIQVIVEATEDVTLTIPASYRAGGVSTTTEIFLPEGNYWITWVYDGDRWNLADNGPEVVPANYIYAAPDGIAGPMVARQMALNDIPDGLITPAKLSYTRSVTWVVACSDLTTALTTGNSKAYFDVPPFPITLLGIRATVLTPSSSGIVTIDANEAGVSILSTKLTIDANETSSVTAATPVVVSDAALAANSRITFDIDTAGTGATGLQVQVDWERAT